PSAMSAMATSSSVVSRTRLSRSWRSSSSRKSSASCDESPRASRRKCSSPGGLYAMGQRGSRDVRTRKRRAGEQTEAFGGSRTTRSSPVGGGPVELEGDRGRLPDAAVDHVAAEVAFGDEHLAAASGLQLQLADLAVELRAPAVHLGATDRQHVLERDDDLLRPRGEPGVALDRGVDVLRLALERDLDGRVLREESAIPVRENLVVDPDAHGASSDRRRRLADREERLVVVLERAELDVGEEAASEARDRD